MPRTPGATNISDRVKRLIATEALAHPTEPREEVATRIVKSLSGTQERVPEWETLLRRISDARKAGPSELEEPWSMAVCQRYEMSPDALPDLFAIQRRSIVGGTTFTIRMAVWAARLRHVVTAPTKRERINKLYQSAMSYAGEEQVAKVLSQDFDTRSLDSDLAFRKEDGSFEWVLYNEAWKLGVIPSPGERRLTTLHAVIEKRGYDKAMELLAPSIDSDEVREIREMLRACPSWPRVDTESAKKYPELRDEVQLANALNDWWEDCLILWLRRFGKTAAWRGMAKEKRQMIVDRLVVEPSDSPLVDIFNELGDTESAKELLKFEELFKEVTHEV